MKPRHFMLVVLCAIALYPLSIGPVMAREQQMAGGPQPVPAVYEPLMQLAMRSPASLDLLLRYLEWWGLPMSRHSRKIVPPAGLHMKSRPAEP